MNRRITTWYRDFPKLLFAAVDGELIRGGIADRADLPNALRVRGPARDLVAFASALGIRSICIEKVAGFRRNRETTSPFSWYCVRALIVIRVEKQRSGLQTIEDRFVLIRACSCNEATKRLKGHWLEYATPYLNSDGQMVSWSLEKILDVFETGETEIDPAGTEVYSKLNHRRMRPSQVWRPLSR
jgi:Domain of unknown function (DUF4288)